MTGQAILVDADEKALVLEALYLLLDATADGQGPLPTKWDRIMALIGEISN